MARIVFVGGFLTGRNSVDKVGEAFGAYFEQPEAFTFSDYVKNPEKVQSAMKDSVAAFHSAGALALDDASIQPNYAYLFNPPLPTSIGKLVVRAGIKTARMMLPGKGIHTASDIAEVASFSAGSITEGFVHPVANFSMLKKISEFDAVASSVRAKNEFVNSQIVWTEDDTFFTPTVDDIASANKAGIRVSMIPGEHDELLLRPESVLTTVFL